MCNIHSPNMAVNTVFIGFVNCIRTNGKTVGHFEGETLIAVRN